MATLTIKNIPDDLYEDLKRYAELNRRSMNSEVILAIEQMVHGRRIGLEEKIRKAHQLREKTANDAISDEEFNRAKRVG